MENVNIRLNLKNIKGAFVKELKGKTTKRCIIIPLEDGDLFEGESGVYLDLAGWANSNLKDGKTHLLKQSFSKKVREAMTDEERKGAPIVGDMKPFGSSSAPVAEVGTIEDDDLPF